MSLLVTVSVDMYNPAERKMEKKQFTGEFESTEEAIEFYAAEFGTDEDDIHIVRVVED